MLVSLCQKILNCLWIMFIFFSTVQLVIQRPSTRLRAETQNISDDLARDHRPDPDAPDVLLLDWEGSFDNSWWHFQVSRGLQEKRLGGVDCKFWFYHNAGICIVSCFNLCSTFANSRIAEPEGFGEFHKTLHGPLRRDEGPEAAEEEKSQRRTRSGNTYTDAPNSTSRRRRSSRTGRDIFRERVGREKKKVRTIQSF